MVVIQRFLVLILIGLSLLFFTTAWELGIQLDLAVLTSSILTIGVAIWLEKKIPYRLVWSKNQGDLKADLVSAGVLIGVIDPLLKIAAPLIIVSLYGSFEKIKLISSLPIFYQVVFVLLAVELGRYWSHRLHHRYSPFWWLHAMHHSSKRLYFLNNMRFHPLNYIINFTIGVLPVMFLGASPEAILCYLAVAQPVVLLQHANIDLNHGILNKIFSTPEVHRWHHSTEPSEANCNFGNAIVLWDHIFGTYKGEAGFDEKKEVGLFSSSGAKYPSTASYAKQLFSMCSSACCRV